VPKPGADGILSVTPYYNKPTRKACIITTRPLAKAIQIPIILYSVQGARAVNIEPATVFRLAEIDNIIGIRSLGEYPADRGCGAPGAGRFHRVVGR